MQNAAVFLAKFQSQIIQPFSICPFEWPNQFEYPQTVQLNKRLILHKTNLLIHGIYLFLVTVKFLLMKASLETSDTMLGLLFYIIILNTFIIRMIYVLNDANLWPNLISLHLLYERSNLGQPKPTGKEKFLLNLVQAMGPVSAVLMPTLVGCISYVNPCMPPFSGFLFAKWYGNCYANKSWTGSLLRGTLSIFNIHSYYSMLGSTSFMTFQGVFVNMLCLVHYLKHVKIHFSIGKNSRDFQKGLQIYRQIQLLGQLFNEQYQGLMIPTIMFGIYILTNCTLLVCFCEVTQIDCYARICFLPILAS